MHCLCFSAQLFIKPCADIANVVASQVSSLCKWKITCQLLYYLQKAMANFATKTVAIAQ